MSRHTYEPQKQTKTTEHQVSDIGMVQTNTFDFSRGKKYLSNTSYFFTLVYSMGGKI